MSFITAAPGGEGKNTPVLVAASDMGHQVPHPYPMPHIQAITLMGEFFIYVLGQTLLIGVSGGLIDETG